MTDRSVTVRLRAEVGSYISGMHKAAQETRGVTTATAGVKSSAKAMADTQELAATRTAKALAGTRAAIGKVDTAASTMRGGLGIAAAAGGAAILGMARDAIEATSDLNEQISATKTIFGDTASEAVLAFAKTAAAIGFSQRAALQAANQYGDYFTKIGYSQKAAATLSESLVRAAGDFASIKDLDSGDVLDKLRAGLSGESEPLRSLGVFLTEAKVKAEGMRLGLADAHGELTEGEKITARYSLILKEMGTAYGDMSRTADSYANRQRRASAETENAKASIGRSLLPVYTDAATVAGGLAQGVGKIGDAFGGFGEEVARHVSPLGAVADAMGFLRGKTDDAADSTHYMASAQEILAHKERYSKEQIEAATLSIEGQKRALDQLLTATQAQFSSEIAYQESLINIRDAVHDYNDALAANKDKKKDNNVSSDELKRKQLEIRSALLQAGDAAVRQAADHAEAAGRTLTESQKYEVFRGALVKLKEQFPQLAPVISDYLTRLSKVPRNVDTAIGVDTTDANADLAAVAAKIEALNGKTIDVDVQVHTPGFIGPTVAEGMRAQGIPGPYTPAQRGQRHALGGWISGPGGPRDDMVPAWLSNGEFVVNAAAARNHASELERINRGSRFADGGWVSGPPGAGSGGMSREAVDRIVAAVQNARPLVVNATGRDLSERELIDEAVFANRAGRLS